MALTLSASWRELQRFTKSECPKLFYTFGKGAESLTIRVTDLVGIWQCFLDRDGIVTSAKEQHASIDPSESSVQLQVLLDRLEQSVESGRNSLSRDKNEHSQSVHLQTRVDLPNPLKPLSWTFKLEPQGAELLAEQLLRPCLHEASVAKQKLESLYRVIKDKDHVLVRLLEKVESLGTDLSLIFPGITGLKSRKGRVTVQEARKHVPGMAEFDRDRWSRGFDSSSPYAGFHDTGMSSLVAGCEQCPKHTVKQHNDWLNRLPIQGGSTNTKSPGLQRSASKKTPEPLSDNDSTGSQSEFETQPTPRHLRKARARKAGESFSSTDDEDKHLPKKPKLGRLGEQDRHEGSVKRKREPASSSDIEQQLLSQPTATRSKDKATKSTLASSETETVSEADNVPEQKPSQPPASQITRTAGSRKLGRLNSGSSATYSRSITPAQQINQDSHTLPQQATPQKQATQRFQLPSHSPSPPQRKGRLGSLRRSESIQQRDVRPTAPTKTDADITYISPPKRKPSRSVSTSNPSTPRKLGRLKQSQQAGSRSNTESVEPNTPSKKRNESKLGAETNLNQDNRLGSATETESEAETTTDHPRLTQKPDNHRSQIDTSFEGSESDTNQQGKSSRHKPSSSPPAPELTKPPAKKETVEEAANRRREELKQKLNGGAGGGRKKRKF